MPTRRYLLLLLILSLTIIVSLSTTVLAQQEPPKTCPMVVSESLTALGTNCANLGRNTSCYGHEQVRHTAFEDKGSDPIDFYINPGDRSDLLQTETIQTGPFNLPQEYWGLNVMNVNANIPLAFAPKGVVYVQFGGVEVENGVQPPEAVNLVPGISVFTSSASNLLSWPAPSIPGHASETIADVPVGSSVSVDAISPDGGFLRAVFGTQVGWIDKTALNTASVDLSGLPTIGENDMTPMQNFYYRTGIGGINCNDAPSMLFVQGPNTAPVDIEVFDQPIRIQSSIVLRSFAPDDDIVGHILELIDLTGLAILYPDTPQEIIVPPGFKATIPLCDPASLGIEGDVDERAVCGTWSAPVPLTADELDICPPLTNIPDNLLNYTIGCPNVIPASGVGQTIPQLFFPDQSALNAARAACRVGALPPEICEYLGITVTGI